MKKEDLLILLLLAFLLLAAIVTMLRGGDQSRHGYGSYSSPAVDSSSRRSYCRAKA